MHIYPDGGSFYLRRALGEKLGVDADHILPGNGSNELIEFLARAFLEPGDEIVMSERAFVIYKLVAMTQQAHTIAVPMDGYTHDLQAMRRAITPNTKLVFVANPNNPTGTAVSPDALDQFIRSVPEDVLVVLDEAYVELLPPEEQPDSMRYVREGLPVCVLRTFSKAYGLAGLRLGYAVASKSLIRHLEHLRQPFNVNAMAHAGALAALDDEEHVQKTRAMVRDGLRYICDALDAEQIAYVPSRVNMLLVHVGDGRTVFKELQQRHVIVRPMDGYGLAEYIRVTIGTYEENRRFIEALVPLLQQESLSS